MDREKVIKGIECEEYSEYARCNQCPYVKFHKCKTLLMRDALALLKERKHGKWTTHRTQQHDGEWYCDQCDYEPTVFEATSYCPNCGAMMELDK